MGSGVGSGVGSEDPVSGAVSFSVLSVSGEGDGSGGSGEGDGSGSDSPGVLPEDFGVASKVSQPNPLK